MRGLCAGVGGRRARHQRWLGVWDGGAPFRRCVAVPAHARGRYSPLDGSEAAGGSTEISLSPAGGACGGGHPTASERDSRVHQWEQRSAARKMLKSFYCGLTVVDHCCADVNVILRSRGDCRRQRSSNKNASMCLFVRASACGGSPLRCRRSEGPTRAPVCKVARGCLWTWRWLAREAV